MTKATKSGYTATDSFHLSGSGRYEKGEEVNQPEPVLKELEAKGLIKKGKATKERDEEKLIAVPENKMKEPKENKTLTTPKKTTLPPRVSTPRAASKPKTQAAKKPAAKKE